MPKTRQQIPRTRPDPKDVYVHGLRFLIADDVMRRAAARDDTLPPMLMFPAMVMSAFAAELFLKCLLILEGKDPPDSHRLRRLFDCLDERSRVRLIDLWRQSIADRESELKENERQLGVKIPRALTTALEDCGDTFERMRYIYENPLMAKFYIIDFAEIVREVVLESRPDWQCLSHYLTAFQSRRASC